MVEIRIQCPKCKHQFTIQGKPQEKIYITCPKCNTPGTFTFSAEKVSNAELGIKNIVVVEHLRKVYGKDIVGVR